MFDKIVLVLLTLCALAMAGTLVAREINDRRVNPGPSREPDLYVDQEWEELLLSGRTVGPADAPVKVVVFVDFECTACRAYHAYLTDVRQRYERHVAMVLVHFPLRQHRYAYEAAHAAECAHAQGRFAEFVDAAFDGQEQFGVRPWTAFASDAGVPQLDAFAACMNDTEVLGMIDLGLDRGRRIGVRGTPSVLINGLRYALPPARPQLMSAVQRIVASLED